MASRPTINAEEAQYLSELRAAQHLDDLPRGRWALVLIAALLGALVAWAALSRVDRVTRADGRVMADGREQQVASLEGGLLAELMVREGARVHAGQPLARLDPTRYQAQQNEGEAKRLALRATIARLEAEAGTQPLRFPADVQRDAATVRAETSAFQARRRALDEAVAANRRSAELLQRELDVAQQMSAQGLLSEVEVMRLQRQLNDQKTQGEERINRFRQDASTELLRVRTDLAQLEEQQGGRADVLRRTVLTSPVEGFVKNIRSGTLGGVVSPGGVVMEIVPASSKLLVEVRVKPAEIGFLHTGQNAELKLSAYDVAVYGGLKGHVEYISPDVLGDPDRPGGDGTYYRVMVRTEDAVLRPAHGEPLPVIPGMTGTVDIRTGERSVLSFLLRPMLRANEVFESR
ncbi:HlyD family efflux transporter periplasmic adaptor subunit [Azohydromonas lata]|uniref:HlyD family efflux transporter periplasmic adaptor subunit n=1 Tax=Azohydromonas lata TaxID=45677 RepID=A0ABU5IH25_9BURK|nr:HlyD family efflux transporter periplasmic adaptor subunit [Azohydromonas lata]MDZ5457233.1 HlyD family efflux transporter periplasmic adaptor subunit [Azohydromonas lata]